MKKPFSLLTATSLAALTLLTLPTAQAALSTTGMQPIKLPEPQLDKPGTVMQALKNRGSVKSIDGSRGFSSNELANILWAVDGVNRADSGKRTAPTGFSRLAKQASVVFVMLKDGVYRHEPETHTLTPVISGDQRKAFGNQDFVIAAPLNLIYALDLNIIDAPGSRRDFEERFGWGNIEIGHKSMAGYLYCAIASCASVYRAGGADNSFVETLKKEYPNLRFVGGQTFGYEK